MKKRHLYLTGFMGSGKSIIGKALRKHLKMPLVDLDKEIERTSGKTIPQIFEESGEAFFRKIESEVLQQISQREQAHIISLGGGAVCFEENRAMIQENGVLVYLQVPVEALVSRLANSRNRPLLLNEDGTRRSLAEIKNIVNELFEKRKFWYEKADICVKIDSKAGVGETVRLVLDHLKKNQGD